jgi:hypothetical protein
MRGGRATMVWRMSWKGRIGYWLMIAALVAFGVQFMAGTALPQRLLIAAGCYELCGLLWLVGLWPSLVADEEGLLIRGASRSGPGTWALPYLGPLSRRNRELLRVGWGEITAAEPVPGGLLITYGGRRTLSRAPQKGAPAAAYIMARVAAERLT